MSHYLAYVYGPTDQETLTRIMQPYNENGNNSFGHELVVLTNIPVMTLETSLFDMIVAFRKVSDSGSYNQQRPILIVDDALQYLDHSAIRELDAFVISYDLDTKAATAKVVVSRAFWDWWVVGGRWEGHFNALGSGWHRNIIDPIPRTSTVCIEPEKKTPGQYNSLPLCDIDWKTAKRKRVAAAFAMWNQIYGGDPTLERQSTILKRMNLPKGVRYYAYDHTEYEAWRKKINAIMDKSEVEWGDHLFSPWDIAGMTRRELIRYAIARTYVPMYGIFWSAGYCPIRNGAVEETFVYDWASFEHPTDQEVKDVIKRVRKLEPHTVVTAIDIHN